MTAENTSMQFLTFALADELYGIEVRSIREILELQKITRIPRSEGFLLGVMNVRGKVVPVIDLRLKFGLPQTERTVDSAIVVLELSESNSDSLIGVLVDRVEQVLELDREGIQPPPRVGTTVNGQLLSGMGKHEEEFILLLRTDLLFTSEDIEIAGLSESISPESLETQEQVAEAEPVG
jgi:purine-binding chemotaxis protein CheW